MLIMVSRIMPLLALLSLLAGCAAVGGGDARPGDTLYVSCRQPLPLHAAPSAFSAATGALPYGAPVTILEVAAAPDPQQAGIPRWARVKSGAQSGYAPLSSLVSRSLLERQARGGSGAGAKAGVQGVGRGFSESVKPDLVATKGGLGSGRSGQAQYGTLNEYLRAQSGDPREAQAGFRREGALAEFNK